jgi:ATP-binding cassette subfamily C protein LapB
MSDENAATLNKQNSSKTHDSLLDCLAFLTSFYGRAKSAQAIVAGLPYTEKGMGPQLFAEASEKLGYIIKPETRAIETLDAALFPVVLLLENNQALVLVEKEEATSNYVCFDPQKKEKRSISLDEIKESYTGELLHFHPERDVTSALNQGFMEAADHSEQTPTHKHWFWSVLLQNRNLILKVMLAALLINLFALASPLYVMNVYDRVIPNNAMETGWVLAIGALTVFVFDFLIKTLRGYFIDLTGRKIDVIVGRRIYDQVLDMKLSGKPASSGMFASMLKEFDAVKEFFTSATISAFVDLPFTLLFILVIYLLAGPVAFVLFGLMLLVMAVGFVLQFPLRHLIAKSLKAAEAKHGLLVETITGLETIKAIRADGKLRARYSDYVGEAAYVSQKSRFFSALGMNFTSFVQQSVTVFVILFGMYMVRDGDLTVGALIGTVMLGGRALAPMGQIASLITRYHQSRSSLKNIDQLMQAPTERPADKRFLHRPDFAGKISLDRVDFSYPASDRKILDNVSFTINAGEKVGIIGRIGSGKSTIARLMMGLYEPKEGGLLMDDTDYRQIDPVDLRRNIGYIAQDVVLFSGTVKDNLIVSNPTASEEDVLHAAKLSGVHDFISTHPQGYDAMIGERGEGLSGGQRQAIALARAILAKPKVLICDEPTNAMDIQSEEAFVKHIHSYAKDQTVILITHRQMLMALVDRLIVIDNGRVLADGPRDKVLKALTQGGGASAQQKTNSPTSVGTTDGKFK